MRTFLCGAVSDFHDKLSPRTFSTGAFLAKDSNFDTMHPSDFWKGAFFVVGELSSSD
jgi:hypothetical protein